MNDTSKPVAESFETKDRWTILAMRVCGHVPELIQSVALGKNKVLMYTFGDAAWTDYDDYMRGAEREPFETIRRVQSAELEFKNNLHRFSND